MATPSRCLEFGDALLRTWDLNALSLRPGLSVQGARSASSVSPESSVWFTAASTAKAGDNHGILANLDPATDLVRTWDLDSRFGVGPGIGANFLDQDTGVVWVSSAADVVHRVDPVGRGQWTWNLPVNPTEYTLRGIRAAPDAALAITLENTSGTGAVLRLDPTTDTLSAFTLPAEPMPFAGAFRPDGLFYFCEFATGHIASLNFETGALVEYRVPGRPMRLFAGADDGVWFVSQGELVGRLDPAAATVAIFSQQGVQPQALTAIPHEEFPRLIGLAGAEPFIDVLCVPPVQGEGAAVGTFALKQTVQAITPAMSRPVLATAEAAPEVTPVAPIGRAQVGRYATQAATATLAVAEHQAALFATGAQCTTSTFRFYQLPLGTVLLRARGVPDVPRSEPRPAAKRTPPPEPKPQRVRARHGATRIR